MSSTPPFGQQLIGQTEKALNAILFRLLDGTGLTEAEWIALVIANGAGRATEAEQALFRRIQTEIEPITERLWGDLPAEDLAVAGRVLGVVLERASAELPQAAR